MSELAEIIRQRIDEQGPLPLSEFMSLALSHPTQGYYMTRDPLGQDGDFITAPEISQMFGEIIGLWCVVTWRAMGEPDAFNLVELGPGRGALMSDALRAVALAPKFLEAARLHLIEISPVLRQKQQEALQDVGLKIPPQWRDSLDQLPSGPLILIANEFFDALPIRQFERGERGWHERLVDVSDGGGFRLTLGEETSFKLGPGAEGAVREICTPCTQMITTIARRLASDKGAALIIDYGYSETAQGDSLQALSKHQFASILAEPGTVDLTAHVNFEALAEAAKLEGVDVHGPLPQGLFLARLGIGQRAQMLAKNASPAERDEILSAYRRLLHGEEMGALFKVLALCHGDLPLPAGFEGGLNAPG